MSHQLAGARAGLINQDFDRMFLDAIEHDPEKLASLTREDYILEAGSEGIELIMWLIMRGALGPRIRRVHEQRTMCPRRTPRPGWSYSRT